MARILKLQRNVSDTFFTNSDHRYSHYKIGKGTYGKPRVLDFQDAQCGKLEIGSFCSISENVTILLSGNHRSDWATTYPFNIIDARFSSIKGHPSSRGDVIIGNDVWIGMDVLIMSGVQIGDGAVIGARSVVTKNVEPYAIVAGNPAKFIRYRFDEATRRGLLELSWWYRSDEWISRHMDLLMSDKFDALLKENGE